MWRFVKRTNETTNEALLKIIQEPQDWRDSPQLNFMQQGHKIIKITKEIMKLKESNTSLEFCALFRMIDESNISIIQWMYSQINCRI